MPLVMKEKSTAAVAGGQEMVPSKWSFEAAFLQAFGMTTERFKLQVESMRLQAQAQAREIAAIHAGIAAAERRAEEANSRVKELEKLKMEILLEIESAQIPFPWIGKGRPETAMVKIQRSGYY